MILFTNNSKLVIIFDLRQINGIIMTSAASLSIKRNAPESSTERSPSPDLEEAIKRLASLELHDKPPEQEQEFDLNADFEILQGDRLFKEGDVAGALVCYENARLADENNLAIWKNLAVCYGKQGEYNKAADCFAKILGQEPKSAETLIKRGEMFLDQYAKEKCISSLDLGIADLERVMEIESRPGRGKILLGYALAKKARQLDLKGQRLDAVARYKESLFVRPNHPQTLTNLGELFLRLKDYQGAKDSFLAASYAFPAGDPDSSKAAAGLSLARLGLGNADRAAGTLFMEKTTSAHASQVLEKGDCDEAINQYTRAIEVNAGGALLYVNRARAYKLTFQYEAALKDLSTARDLDPSDPGILVVKALIHKEREEYKEAEEALKEAAGLSPDSVDIRKKLAEVRFLCKANK